MSKELSDRTNLSSIDMVTWLYITLLLSGSEWGFFGHKLINRVAVYTLPTELISWYKPHIDYLAEHAVDPDKRRYATRHEAVRHYIDLDHWGEFPFDHLPRYWDQVLALNIQLYSILDSDTTYLLKAIPLEQWSDSIPDKNNRLDLVRKFYLPQYYEDEQIISCDSLMMIFPSLNCTVESLIYMEDVFTEHGIVPYHLQSMQRRLTNAFKSSDLESIIRTSAEMGHYIADACVPLHTTSNYNGQLTNQVGIHAFWESRIPELFAVEEFDMVVGTAEYIEDPTTYFWNLVMDSHKEVDKVLNLEKELSLTYPTDKQFCFEDRLNQTVRTQCSSYAEAYHIAMDKMVEDRFRVAVKAVGNSWYTAWIDAGQPPPPAQKKIRDKAPEDEEVDKAFLSGKIKGREHEN
ncbi:MAG TPA: zinc dependent phospholipase C family protein [Saprospiraceae bacterium]|nr:zinc dependent phospholipase C family protein [Saprospiraceae bacterium]